MQIKHASVIENAIVTRLVTDLLAAGLTISVWNGGDEAELVDSTDLEAILAELAASDQDELTMEGPDGYAGWIRLVWGNDDAVISDYSTRLETIMSGANALAAELAGDELPSYERALQSPEDARRLFDASKGGNVPGITEDHRWELLRKFADGRLCDG